MINKPKMYHNKIDKEFHNNKEVYMSTDGEENITSFSSNDIRKKITSIINSNSYIYQTKINIKLKDETIKRKIVGIIDNNLVTIDNEYIPINNIIDVYK